MKRRTLFRAALGTTAAVAAGGGLSALAVPTASAASTGAPARRTGGLPRVRLPPHPADPLAAVVQPDRGIIFPCTRGVYDRLSSPLARYYVYYGPHDAPGGESAWPTATRWRARTPSTRATPSWPTGGPRTTR